MAAYYSQRIPSLIGTMTEKSGFDGLFCIKTSPKCKCNLHHLFGCLHTYLYTYMYLFIYIFSTYLFECTVKWSLVTHWIKCKILKEVEKRQEGKKNVYFSVFCEQIQSLLWENLLVGMQKFQEWTWKHIFFFQLQFCKLLPLYLLCQKKGYCSKFEGNSVVLWHQLYAAALTQCLLVMCL